MRSRFRNAARAAVCAVAAVGALGLAACDPIEPRDPGDTEVQVWLTDASVDFLEEAWVDIGAIEMVPAGGAPISLTTDGTSGEVDLLELREQDPLQIAGQDIEPGVYSQLRITIESARVLLDAAYVFEAGGRERTLPIPAGAQGGVALNLEVTGVVDDSVGAIDVQAGLLVLMVDFDVNQSFVIQGDPEAPEGIDDIVFTPKLRVAVRPLAGSVSGVVRAGATGVDVTGLTVTARPLNEGLLEPYQTQTATAAVGPDGSYTLPFMAPGRYAVNVDVPAGFATEPGITEAVVDAAENVTGINFQIVPGS